MKFERKKIVVNEGYPVWVGISNGGIEVATYDDRICLNAEEAFEMVGVLLEILFKLADSIEQDRG